MKRAIFEWRAQFRGEVRVLKDTDVSDEEIRRSNLILWGDPRSNSFLGKILEKLPLAWDAASLKLGTFYFDSKRHVPLLIFPNPVNPEKYVVLNSGFTFRGFGSNADQTPKLPDYAILDVTDANPFKNGVRAAGFFDESWKVTSERTYQR